MLALLLYISHALLPTNMRFICELHRYLAAELFASLFSALKGCHFFRAFHGFPLAYLFNATPTAGAQPALKLAGG